jgi:phosphate-selective porin OprO/OprP
LRFRSPPTPPDVSSNDCHAGEATLKFPCHTAVLIAGLSAAGFARASAAQGLPQADTTAPSLEGRVEQLEQRVRLLQQLREVELDSAIAAAKARPSLVAGTDGFTVMSRDSAFQLKFRGYVQADGRWSEGNSSAPASSTILVRRARPILEGTLYKYFDFRFMPDFAGASVRLYDAYSDLRFSPAFVVRAGKFIPPVGLEQIQSATDLRFAERGLPTDLVPNRDLGVQFQGDLFSSKLSYSIGIFDGVPDLANLDGDTQNSKDGIARIFFTPFARPGATPTIDLGFGISGSSGHELGTVAAPQLANYTSPGQVTIFKFRSDGATAANTVIADGLRARVSPQGYLNVGPFGSIFEFVRSAQQVRRNTITGNIQNDAWQLSGSWFLTGDRNSFKTVTPKKSFDPSAHTWGAFEVTARYGELSFDPAPFGTTSAASFADPTNSVRHAAAFGTGVNWYLSRGVKIDASYERTTFQGGAAGGADRKPETLVVTRVQTSF